MFSVLVCNLASGNTQNGSISQLSSKSLRAVRLLGNPFFFLVNGRGSGRLACPHLHVLVKTHTQQGTCLSACPAHAPRQDLAHSHGPAARQLSFSEGRPAWENQTGPFKKVNETNTDRSPQPQELCSSRQSVTLHGCVGPAALTFGWTEKLAGHIPWPEAAARQRRGVKGRPYPCPAAHPCLGDLARSLSQDWDWGAVTEGLRPAPRGPVRRRLCTCRWSSEQRLIALDGRHMQDCKCSSSHIKIMKRRDKINLANYFNSIYSK